MPRGKRTGHKPEVEEIDQRTFFLEILILEAAICRLDRIFHHVDLTVPHSISFGQGKVNCSLAGLVVQCTRVHPGTRTANKLHAAQQFNCHYLCYGFENFRFGVDLGVILFRMYFDTCDCEIKATLSLCGKIRSKVKS